MVWPAARVPPGVSVQLRLEAQTPVAAYNAALALLTRTALPLLQGSTLMNLHVITDEAPPEHPVLPAPTTVVATAP